jgi:hypothetical protein
VPQSQPSVSVRPGVAQPALNQRDGSNTYALSDSESYSVTMIQVDR